MLYKRRDGEMARHAPGPHIYIMAFFRTSNDLIKYYMFSFGNSATSAKRSRFCYEHHELFFRVYVVVQVCSSISANEIDSY